MEEEGSPVVASAPATSRSMAELGIEPFRPSCHTHRHIPAKAVLAAVPGGPVEPQEFCATCTERSGKLEGLRLWQHACSCCFSASFPHGLPLLDPEVPETGKPVPKATAVARYNVSGIEPPPPGKALRIDLGETPVALFNVDGALYAIDAVCPHAGGPLDEGELEGGKVTCPWHGSVFDVKTGAVETPPAERGVTAYEVTREAGGLVFRPRSDPPDGMVS